MRRLVLRGGSSGGGGTGDMESGADGTGAEMEWEAGGAEWGNLTALAAGGDDDVWVELEVQHATP